VSDTPDWPGDSRFLKQLSVRLAQIAAFKGVRDRADDVAQETMMVLLRKYAYLQDRAEVWRVANGVLRKKVHEARRGRPTEALSDEFEVTDGRPGVEADLVERARVKEQQTRFRTALSQLGTKCQQLFKLKLLGRSRSEMAALLGITENALDVRHHRCRKQLLEALAALA